VYQNKKQEMSKSSTRRTRTTYRPSTHPQWSRNPNPNPMLEMQISIEVLPAPTYTELCVMQSAMQADVRTGDNAVDKDKIAFLDAINKEVSRCKPKPIWMRRPNESGEPAPPTQHARIDGAQVNELKGILKPETLRRTFISIPALMAQIQADIQAAIQAAIQAKATQKTQAELDAEAEAEILQARRL
jgi:hypothetical protein